MNLKLLFDLNINDNLEENWLKFKNETTLLYTYYYEMSRDECIGIFKLVQKNLADERANKSFDTEALRQINYVMKDIRNHLDYLRNFKELWCD